jgi:protein gp37
MFREMERFGKDPSVVAPSSDMTLKLPLAKGRDKQFKLAPGTKVFTCSWSDWFHADADAWREQAWGIIRKRPDLIFQIVTKRTSRIQQCLPSDWGDGYKNVWLIATAENQEWLDKRAADLLQVPAVVRGLSIEPMLGPMDLRPFIPTIDWIIVGGESGNYARPVHPDWVRSIRDQCQAAGVAFFFKQWGEWIGWDDASYHDRAKHGEHWICSDGSLLPHSPTSELASRFGATRVIRPGKKLTGRIIDGRTWDQFPTAGC